MIVDYQTVTSSDSKRLDEYVRGMLSDGWQPLGGVSMSTYVSTQTVGYVIYPTNEAHYAQTMVRYAEPQIEVTP